MMACERRATRATLSAYETDLWNFFEFLKDQKAEEATPKTIQDYLTTQSHLSSTTVARRMSSLRQFYGYLINRGITKENPVSLVKVVPLKTKSFASLSSTHVERLWEGVKAWTAPEGKRLSLLFQILQATDQLVKEIVSLPISIDQDAPSLISNTILLPRRNSVLGAPHPLRPELRRASAEVEGCATICPSSFDFGPGGAYAQDERQGGVDEALQEYLKIRPYFLASGQESPWLFPSSSQKGHLTPQRFGQLLKELGLKQGIDPELISLSTFRYGLHHFKKI